MSNAWLMSYGDDTAEAEAERTADRVVSGEPVAAPSSGTAPPSAAAVPGSVVRALSSAGAPLETDLRHEMEQRFRHDFSRVRVHTDRTAQQSALDVDADAYTVGGNVVFGPGRYAPGSQDGRRLIAHELTHVVQQGGSAGCSSGATLQRQRGDKKKDKPKPAANKPTAASAPKLDLTPSKHGDPCACLIVVHNEEANARRTANAMHQNCAYNLALVAPDTGKREIAIPGKPGTVDPNSMFPRSIAEKCLDDEQTCRDFVTANAGATDPKVIEEVVQTQFFLAVDDCSKGFSLPVVALHNNDIEDTKNYLKNKDQKGTSDLKLDIDKTDAKAGAEQVKNLKDLLRSKFGPDVEKELQTPRKTNIFRWCAADDLARCHIGDPDHPDNITWVTNEQDFIALSKKDVNVAWQAEAPKGKASESEGDLSTLFPLLRDILDTRLPKLMDQLEKGRDLDWKEIDRLLDDIQNMRRFGDLTFDNLFDRVREIINLLLDALLKSGRIATAPAITRARIAQLRYVNIEMPGKRLSQQPDAERIRNYESVVDVLKALGLHCCGDDPKKAEAAVKDELKVTP